jgi:putative SOS response-associated peptidase YedK
MCTNYRPTARDIVQQRFAATLPEDAYPPETFPGYLAPAIRVADRQGGAAREGLLGRFGLIPHWAKDLSFGRHTYNARSETVAEKPSFRDAWRRSQRCLVPMEAFYEPNWESGRAVRWRIALGSGEPFAVAGLWASWKAPNGVLVQSFTLLTVNADSHPVMNRFHRPGDEKRSLVLLPESLHDEWLSSPVARAAELLAPPPLDALVTCAEPKPARQRS